MTPPVAMHRKLCFKLLPPSPDITSPKTQVGEPTPSPTPCTSNTETRQQFNFTLPTSTPPGNSNPPPTQQTTPTLDTLLSSLSLSTTAAPPQTPSPYTQTLSQSHPLSLNPNHQTNPHPHPQSPPDPNEAIENFFLDNPATQSPTRYEPESSETTPQSDKELEIETVVKNMLAINQRRPVDHHAKTKTDEPINPLRMTLSMMKITKSSSYARRNKGSDGRKKRVRWVEAKRRVQMSENIATERNEVGAYHNFRRNRFDRERGVGRSSLRNVESVEGVDEDEMDIEG